MTMRRSVLIAVLFAIAVSVPTHLVLATVDTAGSQEPSASDILRKVAEVYAECRTYRDQGVMETYLLSSSSEFRPTNETRFFTAFIRPRRYRFEFSEKTRPQKEGNSPRWDLERRHIAWSDGTEMLIWSNGYSGNGILRPPSFQQALLTTGPAGANIIQLLMPDIFPGNRITQLARLRRESDKELDGVECYRLSGERGTGVAATTVWIDKRTFLIRRIDQKIRSRNTKSNSRITYQPAINEDFDRSLLRFGVD